MCTLHRSLPQVGCKRVPNALLNTVDFVSADGRVVLRVCEEERSRLIFQMGACSLPWLRFFARSDMGLLVGAHVAVRDCACVTVCVTVE